MEAILAGLCGLAGWNEDDRIHYKRKEASYRSHVEDAWHSALDNPSHLAQPASTQKATTQRGRRPRNHAQEGIARALANLDAERAATEAERAAVQLRQETRLQQMSQAKIELDKIIRAALGRLQAVAGDSATFREGSEYLTLSTPHAKLMIDVWDDISMPPAVADTMILGAAVIMRNIQRSPLELYSANLVYEQSDSSFCWHMYRYRARDRYLFNSSYTPIYRPDRRDPPVNPHGCGLDFNNFVERRRQEVTNEIQRVSAGNPFNSETLLSLFEEALNLRLANPEQ